jgi:RNA polymerase sigma factor (sigma-70 family)
LIATVSDDRRSVEHEARLALEAGDRRHALEVLLGLYGKAIYGYCRRMVRDPDLADDLLQTTFLQAYDSFPGFDGRSTLRTWLFGIAHHRCLDALKSRQRWWRRVDPLEEIQDVPEASGRLEDQAVADDTRRVLETCLERLSPQVRAAVVLRFREGYSYVEMADLSGERAPTLQARVVRALPLLRRCVERKGLTL